MDFVHCNVCMRKPSNECKNYCFSNCGHVYCKSCTEKQQIPSTNGYMCKVCKKQCQFVDINSTMPKRVASLFTPPEKLINEHQKKMERIQKFQEEQQRLFRLNFSKQRNALQNAAQQHKANAAKSAAMEKELQALKVSEQYHKNQLAAAEEKLRVISHLPLKNRYGDVLEVSSYSDPAPSVHGDMSFTGFKGIINASINEGNTSVRTAETSTSSAPNLDFLDISVGSQSTNNHMSFGNLLGDSEPSTPISSQRSDSSLLTTPRILGLPKRTPVRSDNPYVQMWNKQSAERQKRARATPTMPPSSSPLVGSTTPRYGVTSGNVIPRVNTPSSQFNAMFKPKAR